MPRPLLLFLTVFSGLFCSGQLGFDRGLSFEWERSSIVLEEGSYGKFSSAAEAYTEVNRLIIEESWAEAELLLAQLMTDAEDNRNFAYKRALCLRSMKGRLAEAVPLVHKAIDGDFTRRYNAFDVNATVPPAEALDLALEVLQFAGHYAEAQAVAMVIMERYPKRDFRHAQAKQASADCAFAARCVENQQPMDIVAEEALNSVSSDYAPVITPDGNVVYFTSYRDDIEGLNRNRGRIFKSSKTGNEWSPPVALDLGESNRDMTTVGLIGDEEALVIYQSNRNAGSLWELDRDSLGGWALKEKVGYPVASRHWETSLTERFDGQERIFVSDRPGGMGGRDLYRSVLLPNGTWSEPLNLGRRINTEGEEESPVVSADGRTMMFASNGHQGMGGFDLFRCVRLDNGSWSDPEHMGAPLNTPRDEAMVSLDASGQTGYLSSARAGGDDMDIYRVDFTESANEALAVFIGDIPNWVKGDVLEVKSVDDGPAIFRVFRARSGSGSFVAAIPPCREYRFKWMRKGETLAAMNHFVDCNAAYGNGNQVQRLDLFGENVTMPIAPDDNEGSEDGRGGLIVETVQYEVLTETVVAPSHSFDVVSDGLTLSDTEEAAEDMATDTEEENNTGAQEIKQEDPSLAEDPTVAEDLSDLTEETPLTLVEFEALSAVIEFGYGRYMTQTTSSEVKTVASEIAARCALGEVPVLQIEGSASFVPVKNKRAYESNEELARMRAEKARDAMITAMSAEGLQIGVDYQIVLDWKVAGPEFKGDAIAGQEVYKNYQFAKFSLGRQLVEKRH